MSEIRFEDLVSRFLDDDLTPDELSNLVKMVRNDPERAEEIRCQLEAASLLAQSEAEEDSTNFLKRLQARIETDAAPSESQSVIHLLGETRPQRRWLTRPRALMAAAVLLAMIGFAFFVMNREASSQPDALKMARVIEMDGSFRWTGDGGLVRSDVKVSSELGGGTLESLSAESWAVLELRDGTRLMIFGQSMLTMSEHQQQKEVHLRAGTISADVKPQPRGKPMLIHTPTALLEVLGTQLNVAAESSSTMLNVNEGRVRITRLTDGRVQEVPADHQVTASVNSTEEFQVTRRPQPVPHWKSGLPEKVIYGKWQPETKSLRATPLLLKPDGKLLLVYLAAVSVSRGQPTPVQPVAGGRFRIRGRLERAGDITFGLTMQHPKGGFAGKYILTCKADTFPKPGELFDIELRLEDFRPMEDWFPKSPIGLVLFDWWGVTVHQDAGLSILNVELMSPAS